MKCVSCETEINPKWKHAIDINVCPFCGKHIMEEHLKNCLTTLAAAMDAMAKYPEQLDDWLLSNHNYIKTDSPNLKQFLPKEAFKEIRKELDEQEFQEKKKSVVKIKTLTEDGDVIEQDVVVEKMASDDRTQTFHDRANNMLKQERAVDGDPKSVAAKTRDLKAMAAKIKQEAAAQAEGGVASMISKEMMAEADPESVAEFRSMITTGDIVSSGLPPAADGDDDDIPDVVLAMAGMKQKGGTGGGANEKDLHALAKMQAKAQGASKRLGAGKGSFSRG